MNRRKSIIFILSVWMVAFFQQFASASVKVVLARNPLAVNERNVCNAIETGRLFDRALLDLTGAKTQAEAWKVLGLTGTDTVAIKVNCNNWTIALNPHRELIDALCRSLQAVIPANRIIIYDNAEEALIGSGFAINRSAAGVRFVGTDHGDGFDTGERLTRIITATASKVINLASLKCVEGDMAVSLFLKNQIGSLLPEDMAKCHDDPDFLAEVSSRPSIKNKTILNLCDGLRGSYRRGVPWYWGGIIMSVDPVAAEATALQVINEKRQAKKLRPLAEPEALRIAESKYHLGTRGRENIVQMNIEM
jgi:hypothetical protein